MYIHGLKIGFVANNSAKEPFFQSQSFAPDDILTHMDTVFKERYARLNPRQKEAVDTIEGPVMVIAGPGTGKTTILTLRIAHILQKTDTPPGGILAITFTEAGVKAMRMKLREVIGTRADEVRIHTFHGFALSIITEFPDHFAHISRARQLTGVEAEALIRDILADKKYTKLRPFGNPDLYVGSILHSIAESKKEAWTPGMLHSFVKDEIKRIKSDDDNISTRGASKGSLKADALKRIEKCEKTALLADIFEEYEARKKKEELIDFDDLIIELLLALECDELLLRLVQEKFLYILVDEHQDTNDSQNLLVRMIANFFENPNLFVVGDEKQAIYRFQGASVQNFVAFQNLWQSMKLISLSDNYRSHQGILDAGYSLIENNYTDDEHKNLRIELSSKVKGKPIECISAGNVEAGLEYLAQSVEKIIKADKKETIAVIVRTNRDVERILTLFQAHGIEASAERGADIFAHPLGSLYFDLIEFLADHSKVMLLARTLSMGLWNLEFSKSVEIIGAIKSGNIGSLEKSLPVLKPLFADMTRVGPIEYLISAAEVSGFVHKAIQDPLSAEIWRGIISLAQDLAKRDSIDDPQKLIEALLSYRKFAETKTVKIAAGKADALVSIMTAHGSKGLEYDFVFIPFANEESWMPRVRSSYFVLPKEKEEGDDVRDSRRLFYVAVTRAKQHVSIITSLTDSLGKDLTPLRFIGEISEASISHTKISAHTKPARKIARADDLGKKELVEYAKNSLLTKGLSVTALNHFLTCPNKFFYKSIMRVPEPPSASSEKGNAMHEAMARAWRSEDKSAKAISLVIIDAVREYFTWSLLPAFEKEAILEELIASAPIVAKALSSHFSQTGSTSVETWVDTAFVAKIADNQVEFRIHGKLDALLVTDDKVNIFDYKTKEAMSVAAIRGETKSDDGGYFRQLIYYKILTSSDSRYKGKMIEPALVFIKPDEKGRCPIVTIPITKADEDRVRAEIQNLAESVWNGEILEKSCDDRDCDGCKFNSLRSRQ